jgi:DNA-directed RNA polymerase specialized sigma24 family protein
MKVLSDYNQVVLQKQDEAFTLAYYLLDSEVQAAEVVQSAFIKAFDCVYSASNDVYIEVLRHVVQGCCQKKGQKRLSLWFRKPQTELFFQELPDKEKMVLLLVDVLKLNYATASQVLKCSEDQIRQELAQARRLNCN